MKKLITLFLLGIAFSLNAQLCVDNTSGLKFDGVGSYVVLATSSLLEITDSITIEAWIKDSVFAPNPSNGTIVCKHGWYNGEEGYVLRAGGQGQLSFNICGDSLGNSVSWKEVVSPTNAIQLNTWTHVAATFDGYYLKVYVNGVLSNSSAFTGGIRWLDAVMQPCPLAVRSSSTADVPLRCSELAELDQGLPGGRLIAEWNRNVVWNHEGRLEAGPNNVATDSALSARS